MPHTVPRSAVFLRPPRRAGAGGGGRTRGALRTRVGAAPAGRVARRRRRRGNAGWLDRRTAGIEGSGPGVAAVEPVPGCSVASEWRIAPVSRNATQHRRGDGTARGPASGPGDGTAHGSATEPGDGTAPRFGDPARATAPPTVPRPRRPAADGRPPRPELPFNAAVSRAARRRPAADDRPPRPELPFNAAVSRAAQHRPAADDRPPRPELPSMPQFHAPGPAGSRLTRPRLPTRRRAQRRP